jgi:hypothetical protein
MTEIELRALAGEIEWPATPDFASRLEPVLAQRPRPGRRRRALLVALAAAVLAVAVAMAVPQARSSILRFFHLGGVTIERVDTLPPAEERPLAADLGDRVTAEQAALVLGTPFALPRAGQAPALYERSGVVSALLAAPGPVLLSQSRFTGLMKKAAAVSTSVEQVSIAPGAEGIWITGAAHVFFGPELPPRLAGNVLLWEKDGVTFRLEGRTLTRERALELARQIART